MTWMDLLWLGLVGAALVLWALNWYPPKENRKDVLE